MSTAKKQPRKAGKAHLAPDRVENMAGGSNRAIRSASGRDSRGRFLKGVSGNLTGRPPLAPEAKQLLLAQREMNIGRLVELRDQTKDGWLALEATKILLAYDLGKPVVSVDQRSLSLSLNTSGPLPDAASASRIYAEVMGNPAIDLDQLCFAERPALPASVPEEEQPK